MCSNKHQLWDKKLGACFEKNLCVLRIFCLTNKQKTSAEPSCNLVEFWLKMSWVEVELRANKDFHRGLGHGWKILFRSAHIAEEHLFSMFPSILAFNFDLIFRSLLLIYSLLFSWCPAILTFNSVLIFGSFWLFSTQMAFFWPWLFSTLFWGLLIKLKKIIFCASFNFNFGFWPKSGSFCGFWGPNGPFLGVRVRFKYCFGVYSCFWTTFFLCFLHFCLFVLN